MTTDPLAAPALSLQTIAFRRVADVADYVLATTVPGKATTYQTITPVLDSKTGLMTHTPDPVPGVTVNYGLRTNRAGSAWAKPEISIAWPAAPPPPPTPPTARIFWSSDFDNGWADWPSMKHIAMPAHISFQADPTGRGLGKVQRVKHSITMYNGYQGRLPLYSPGVGVGRQSEMALRYLFYMPTGNEAGWSGLNWEHGRGPGHTTAKLPGMQMSADGVGGGTTANTGWTGGSRCRVVLTGHAGQAQDYLAGYFYNPDMSGSSGEYFDCYYADDGTRVRLGKGGTAGAPGALRSIEIWARMNTGSNWDGGVKIWVDGRQCELRSSNSRRGTKTLRLDTGGPFRWWASSFLDAGGVRRTNTSSPNGIRIDHVLWDHYLGGNRDSYKPRSDGFGMLDKVAIGAGPAGTNGVIGPPPGVRLG